MAQPMAGTISMLRAQIYSAKRRGDFPAPNVCKGAGLEALPLLGDGDIREGEGLETAMRVRPASFMSSATPERIDAIIRVFEPRTVSGP